VDKALNFLHATKHIRLFSDIILQNDSGKQWPFELKNTQKYTILKAYYSSAEFTSEEKASLRDAVMKDDNNDEAKVVAVQCDSLVPYDTVKEALWAEITDAETKEA